MMCDKCGIREANIRYTEVFNGVKTEHNLCAQCAKEMDLAPCSAWFEGDFPIEKVLSSLLGLTDASINQNSKSDVICPTCGTTYEEFIKNSRFGCADCYHVFDPLLGEKIKKLQDNSTHTGKHPKIQPKARTLAKVSGSGELSLSTDEQINQLKRQLEAALLEENYETAAACRDKIRNLKGANGHD